ncbi:MAG: hypothetical protein QOH76_240 [Thermoleophilaceae bacterium]|jgi:hypothetical protein|nr:hypothetical protein [Thermoleophilaceae bacterium]
MNGCVKMLDMLVTIFLIWLVVIPLLVIGLAELAARRRECELRARYGAVSRSSSSGSGRRPAPGPRFRLSRTR